MPPQWFSRLARLTVAPCAQCGQPVRDDFPCCPGCGAVQKAGLRQVAVRVAKKALVGAAFGVIIGAPCAVLLEVVHILPGSRSHVTLVAMARLAELCVFIGGMLGAVCVGIWEACRND